MGKSQVTDTDLGLRALLGRIKGSKGLSLTVGVHGPEGEQADAGGGPLTVAQIATVHEYGLGKAYKFKPGGRSFIRSWFDQGRTANLATLNKIGQAVIQGRYTAAVGLERAGLLFVAQIQARISQGIPPPLDEKTIERKGSTVPLIDTGQLRSSIRSKVTQE